MNTYTVSFFGHRRIDEHFFASDALDKLITELLTAKEYLEILVGRDGEFDQLVASSVRRCKRTIRDHNSSLVLVLPYDTSEYRNNIESFQDYYDEVEISTESEISHFKAAHKVRNRSMLHRSDLAVFFVKRHSGGAYTTMKYAQSIGIKTLNLHDKCGCEDPDCILDFTNYL